jgi:hypothetical protein
MHVWSGECYPLVRRHPILPPLTTSRTDPLHYKEVRMTDVVNDASGVIDVGGRQTMLAPQEVHRMLALQAQGWGAKRISKELGCSRNTVRQYLRSGGWKPMDVSGRASILAPHLAWLEQRQRRAQALPGMGAGRLLRGAVASRVGRVRRDGRHRLVLVEYRRGVVQGAAGAASRRPESDRSGKKKEANATCWWTAVASRCRSS